MILDRLVLHNVGTFRGRHTIELLPPNAKKPVVLIGGLNGAGKTTVLEAIHLVLYGSLAQVSGRRAGGYENYLRGLIHNGVPESEGAAIELTFSAYQEGAEREYWVRRSWRSTGASVREILLVSVDGRHDPALTSTWNEHVNSFLPRGIAGLFFFDGEQIEALADMERSREVVGSALAALLGVELVDQLSTDLAVLRRRHQGARVPSELRATIEQCQRAVTSARREEETASQKVAALRVEAERAEKSHFEVSERYRSAGGDLVDQRESAEASVVQLRNDLTRADESLREELGGSAPLLQLRDLLADMSVQASLEAEADRSRLLTETVTERDNEILGLLRDARAKSDLIKTVETFMETDRERRCASADVAEVVGMRDTVAIDHLLTAVLPSTEKRLDALVDRAAAVQSDLDNADRVLAAMPDPEALSPLLAERDNASAALLRKHAELTHAEERLVVLRQERTSADAAYETALNDAAHANLAVDDKRRLVEHVDRVRATLEALRAAANRRHVGQISELILEALNRLLRKENLITEVHIDPDTFAIELTGSDSRHLPAQDLSAGERQLLAVALLWGLARASGQPLPVVIDTPLGRLDGSHRGHLIERYFPYASHQVVLLSTDTEIDDAAYKRIAKHVGRSYQLVFDPTDNSTSVQQGYFWE